MKKMHIYSHTHWDYEWYFTANESIVQLIYHMDEVIEALENGNLNYYLLDSQTSILEEYLSFMPSKMEILKKLIKNGKLMIGPWYTQSDELIISGESLARNLWYGIQYARKMGGCLEVGYLPDSFGQSKDMPKLYQGFNIDNVLFWRGLSKEVCNQREFTWKSMDGSSVLAYNIREGYFYGGNLIYTDDVNVVEERFLKYATTNDQLFSVGGDQRYVDFNIKERIAFYNKNTTHNIEYIESDLKSFYKELSKEKELPIVEGEFIDASVSKIHHSIYSSRYDHKVLNDQIENRMIYQLEPFMVMQQMVGIIPKIEVLEKLWKKILLNHAHDSACGCNSDKTNASILQRLNDCDQMSSTMLDYQVRKVSESIEGIKENDLIVYNTLPYTRKMIKEMEISTQYPFFDIIDEKCKRVPFDILSLCKEYSGSIREDTTKYDEKLYYYKTKIRIAIDMKPISMAVLHINKAENKRVLKSDNQFIENKFYRIELKENKLVLFNKVNKTEIYDFIYVEDGGDDGDTYDYSPPKKDKIYYLNFNNVKFTIDNGETSQILNLEGNWKLPSQIYERENNQSDQVTSYQMKIQLDHDNLIKFNFKINNNIKDHRMRIIVHSGTLGTHTVADTIFGTVERESNPIHMSDWKEIAYREEPTPIYPMLHHVTTYDGDSCSLYTRGIKEYEKLDKDKIALTLFRSVSHLGKPDLKRRPGIASGNEFKYIETPDSQLLKPLAFNFAISYDKNYDSFRTHKNWMFYANEALYYQIQEINRFVNTQKYFVTHPYSKKIKKMNTFLNMDKMKNVVFTSLLPVDNKSYSLRLLNTRWNISDNELLLLSNVKSVEETNFLMEKKCSVKLQNEELITNEFESEEIKTYKINIE